jgi:glutamine amidotransferase
MQELSKSHASLPSTEELTLTLRELVPQVRHFGSFNFLLSNGEALWAHCSTRLHWLVRQHPFAPATLMDRDWTVNFAELNHPGDRAAVIVTTPLTHNETWTAFEPDELKVFVDGLPVLEKSA